MCATKAPKNFASPYMMQQMGGGQPPSVFAGGAQTNVDVTNQAKPMPGSPDLTGDAGPPAAGDNQPNPFGPRPGSDWYVNPYNYNAGWQKARPNNPLGLMLQQAMKGQGRQ